jgi:hypothetical protein
VRARFHLSPVTRVTGAGHPERLEQDCLERRRLAPAGPPLDYRGERRVPRIAEPAVASRLELERLAADGVHQVTEPDLASVERPVVGVGDARGVAEEMGEQDLRAVGEGGQIAPPIRTGCC